jgi:hypothetical protein
VGFMLCDCPAALDVAERGRLWVRCRTPGCNSIWYRPPHDPAATTLVAGRPGALGAESNFL